MLYIMEDIHQDALSVGDVCISISSNFCSQMKFMSIFMLGESQLSDIEDGCSVNLSNSYKISTVASISVPTLHVIIM